MTGGNEMQKKTDGFQEFSMEKAAALSKSSAAKALYAHLQQTNGDALRTAMEQASSGNYAAVKETMQQLLKDPQAQELLKKLQE